MSVNHLFVYGSLAPNGKNHHIMTPIPNGTWQPASVRGKVLADGGQGSAKGYPVFLPDEQGDIVNGFLFSSPDLINHWQRLDEFEGESYQRVEVMATLDNGEQVTAFVYALSSPQDY